MEGKRRVPSEIFRESNVFDRFLPFCRDDYMVHVPQLTKLLCKLSGLQWWN